MHWSQRVWCAATLPLLQMHVVCDSPVSLPIAEILEKIKRKEEEIRQKAELPEET